MLLPGKQETGKINHFGSLFIGQSFADADDFLGGRTHD
jgi:hypothetical protein